MNNIVLLTINPRYENPAAITLTSLMRYNPEQRVMLFTTQITDRIKALVDLYPTAELKQIEPEDTSWFQGAKWLTPIDVEGMCLRLKALDIIATDYPDIEKVLYLDCDTVINHTIQGIWNAPLGDSFVAAALDYIGLPKYKKLYSYHFDWERRMKLNRNYFNSGVMLLNMKLIAEHFHSELSQNFKKEHDRTWLFPDQDYLNQIFARDRKTVIMPKVYNWMPEICMAPSMDAQELMVSRRNSQFAKIIHFNGVVKPWTDEPSFIIPNETHLQLRFDLYHTASCYADELTEGKFFDVEFLAKIKAKHESCKFIPMMLGQSV